MTEITQTVGVNTLDRQQSESVIDPLTLAPLSRQEMDVDHAATTDDADQEDDGVIACICAYQTDDGNTIQCDKCLSWQHILCYYPPPADTPDEASAHYCLDCLPRQIDARKATERQRKALDESASIAPAKRPPPKSHKKKQRDSPTIPPQTKSATLDRKSATPRDLPPPAKRPKIAHRPSVPENKQQARKRTSTTSARRSHSQSPDDAVWPVIPHYSSEFLHLFSSDTPQVETATNLMDNIAVTNSLSDWLVDSEAVAKITRGLTPSEIFQRWDARIEDIPGRPDVGVRWVEDPRFTQDGLVPRWAQLVVEDQLAPRAFIGELRGRIGHLDHYLSDPDSRWQALRHPLPFVFFHPQLPICIDARQEGSIFRYVRRSCTPNAKLQTIITEGTEHHFCFMATKDIMPGEEVTIAWQVPESISGKIATSFDQTNNVQPNVREYISHWVSKVLANCGPCACNTPSNCLMAHYDRRGLPQPRARKSKRNKMPLLETSLDTLSARSISEPRKSEPQDDDRGHRSHTESRGSASRDITPHAHDVNGVPHLLDMSARERKKLMREEEMFKRQDEASGRNKKKRPSGGSNLNTPISATPVRGSAARGSVDMASDRQPARKTSAHGSRKQSISKLAADVMSADEKMKRSARSSKSAGSPPRPVYVDASVQCEMDVLPVTHDQSLKRRKRSFVSVTQRLLRRCLHNNSKRKASMVSEETDEEYEPMDLDPSIGPSGAIDKVHQDLPVVSQDHHMGDDDDAKLVTLKISNDRSDDHVAMPNGQEDAKPETTSMLPPPLPRPPSISVMEGIAYEQSIDGPEADQTLPQETLADVRLQSESGMPPVEEMSTADKTQDTMNVSLDGFHLAQSPDAAMLAVKSPLRKKLSLSDYTKRSKAKDPIADMSPSIVSSVLLVDGHADEAPPLVSEVVNGDDVRHTAHDNTDIMGGHALNDMVAHPASSRDILEIKQEQAAQTGDSMVDGVDAQEALDQTSKLTNGVTHATQDHIPIASEAPQVSTTNATASSPERL